MKKRFTYNRQYKIWQCDAGGYSYQIMKVFCVTLDNKGQLVDVEEFNSTLDALEQMERRLNK